MIPHRMQNNEFFGNGLKDRVTACRKRLRLNRSVHQVLLDHEPVEFSEETTAIFLDEYPAVRESSFSRRNASESRDRKTWEPIEQEVGIT